MRRLAWELKRLVRQHPEGSFSTRHNREKNLLLIARQLEDLKFKNLRAAGIRPKHVDALVRLWLTERSKQTGESLSIG
ncbi:MAG: hypothetical protein OES09_18160, partial [Gammaproteobacteria bacterium]|nr:hypothetical protein [Gammaproteobacteria bacterium]